MAYSDSNTKKWRGFFFHLSVTTQNYRKNEVIASKMYLTISTCMCITFNYCLDACHQWIVPLRPVFVSTHTKQRLMLETWFHLAIQVLKGNQLLDERSKDILSIYSFVVLILWHHNVQVCYGFWLWDHNKNVYQQMQCRSFRERDTYL